MLSDLLRYSPIQLQFEDVAQQQQELCLKAVTVQPEASCPSCFEESKKVHSRYQRHPKDLPVAGRTVSFFLQVRRFFCGNENCQQKIFCERIPWMLSPHARRTKRLEKAQRDVAFSLGGEVGSRLLERLSMSTSPDTLLRSIRRSRFEVETPRVLGVDDWAFRKGCSYGTILVDLEQQQVIDLLDSREAEALANWLKENPGVEVISRDRSTAYAKGATEGAPNATQVADRFHLVKNLVEALEKMFLHNRRYLQQAAELLATQDNSQSLESENSSIVLQNSNMTTEHSTKQTTPEVVRRKTTMTAKAERVREERKQRRLEKYHQVRRLRREGHTHKEIMKRTKLSRSTVSRYLNGEFPEDSRPSRKRTLDQFREQIQQLWQVECKNASQLWKKLRALGFGGSIRSVQRYVQSRLGYNEVLAPRNAAWLLVYRKKELTQEECKIRALLFQLCPMFREASRLAKEFQKMLSKTLNKTLEDWMKEAQEVCPELRSFVTGLRREQRAVENAIRLEWSNGQTEGQVNRLKTLKRQMYGRAKLDLLRQRMLNPL